MKTRLIRSFGARLVATALVIGFPGDAAFAAASPDSGRRVVGTRHSITLPTFEPDVPNGPGRDEYLAVCASCHSTRYVPMQPRLTERQWTDSVDKMIKVHGAQIDAAQRQAIIGYLTATHGPSAAAGSGDDEDGVGSRPAVAASSSMPVLTPAADAAGRAEELARGAELYRQWCAACHGVEGRGDGLVAPVLLRKPEDLTASRYTFQAIVRALWDGSPGTAMPSWRGMASSNLVALASYVQGMHRTPEAGAPSAESVKRGASVFQQSCAPCHGATGEGDGLTASSLYPKPANFTGKRPDRDFLLQVLETGVPGTGMPSWREPLSEADRAAVADYVRTLFRP